MKYPRWSSKFISPSEIHAVATAVKAAEAGTVGEIVPMVVRQSARTGYLTMQLFTALTLLTVFVYIELRDQMTDASWYAMGLIVLLWPVSAALARVKWVQRLFTPPADREFYVHARATLEFYSSGFQNTKEHTGVLIFLSLMEKKCVVLADSGISSKLPEDTWKNLVELIVKSIGTGKPGEGLIKAIEQCGVVLSQHFPSSGQHDNQIPNQLIIKE